MIHCKRSYIILIKKIFFMEEKQPRRGNEGTKIKRARPWGVVEPRGKRVREWGAESEGRGVADTEGTELIEKEEL